MDNVLAIAKTTYGRHASSKGLYLLWVLLIVLIAAMDRYDTLSIGRAKILMVDMGLALVALVGACSVLVLGFDVPRELRLKLAENLLSKPVGRDQYLVGKMLGSFLFALTNMLFIAVGFFVVLVATGRGYNEQLLPAVVSVVGMILLLTATAAFFGTFLSEVPAVIATFLVFWLGHSTQAVLKLSERGGEGAHRAGQVIYGLLPNLNLLNARSTSSESMFAFGPPLTWKYVSMSFSYAVIYSAVLMAASLLIFRRRDI